MEWKHKKCIWMTYFLIKQIPIKPYTDGKKSIRDWKLISSQKFLSFFWSQTSHTGTGLKEDTCCNIFWTPFQFCNKIAQNLFFSFVNVLSCNIPFVQSVTLKVDSSKKRLTGCPRWKTAFMIPIKRNELNCPLFKTDVYKNRGGHNYI